MPDRPAKTPRIGDKALEMTMRDVLDGLEDFATMAGYEAYSPETFEILSIESPDGRVLEGKPPISTPETPILEVELRRHFQQDSEEPTLELIA
jgi:hypothetical protein